MSAHVDAELTFEMEAPDGQRARGRLRGRDNRLTLEIDHPGLFAGGRDAPVVRRAAESLAARGIAVRVEHEGRHLVTLGDVSAPWWQRRATGTRRIRIGSLRGAWTSARSRASAGGPVLPDASSVPPATLFPIAPTFARRVRRAPGTTHDPAHGGGARLVAIGDGHGRRPGQRPGVHWLDAEETTIGSGPDCDVVLTGLAPHHATVVHDELDEYRVVPASAVAAVRVHGARVPDSQLLRTGARMELGGHTLGFYREEFADHGRPYGGRIGGEAGHQRPQPPRTVARA